MALKALSIILVIVLVIFTFYVLIAEGVIDFSDPYPSEETPLSIQPWGLTWDIETILADNGTYGMWYSSATVHFTRYDEGGSFGSGDSLVGGTFIGVEDFVPPTTIEEAEDLNTIMNLMYGDGGTEVHVFIYYFISDETDPLTINQGDRLSLVYLVFRDGVLSSTGFEEGYTYEFELNYYSDEGSLYQGYGFAVHDGELYSWVDHGPVDDPLS